MAKFNINIADFDQTATHQYRFDVPVEWVNSSLSDTEFRGAEMATAAAEKTGSETETSETETSETETSETETSETETSETTQEVGPLAGAMNVSLQQMGEEFLVQGDLDVAIEADCVRCLDPIGLPIQSHFAVIMRQKVEESKHSAPAEEDEGDGGDEMLVETFEGDNIVLDDVIRQHILLEAPVDPLHEKSQCNPEVTKYISNFEGNSPTIDPRLAPLLKLQGQLPAKNTLSNSPKSSTSGAQVSTATVSSDSSKPQSGSVDGDPAGAAAQKDNQQDTNPGPSEGPNKR